MDRVRTFCRIDVGCVGGRLRAWLWDYFGDPFGDEDWESSCLGVEAGGRRGLRCLCSLGETLRAGKIKPGTVFEVKTTQRVPVSADAYLKHGAKIRGEVVASDAGDGTAAHPWRLSIRFTQLSYQGRRCRWRRGRLRWRT